MNAYVALGVVLGAAAVTVVCGGVHQRIAVVACVAITTAFSCGLISATPLDITVPRGVSVWSVLPFLTVSLGLILAAALIVAAVLV